MTTQTLESAWGAAQWGTVADWIYALSNCTIAIAAVMAALSLKRNLRGQSEYQLARVLMLAVFKVRDSIQAIRNPSGFPEESGQEYQRRFDAIYAAFRELQTTIVEAEMFDWNKEKLRSSTRQLHEIFFRVHAAIDNYFQYLKDNKRGVDLPEEAKKQNDVDRTIIYNLSSWTEPDAITVQLDQAVESFKPILSAHLGSRRR